MAFDAFLKIEGIDGESTDQQRSKEIEIESYTFGVSQPSAGARGSGGSASAVRANWTDFTVVKALDVASPKLLLYCARATKIPTVTLSIFRATGDKDKYMEYKLSDVIISAVVPSGDTGGEGGLPMESVSFNYKKIEVKYTLTAHDRGLPAGDTMMNWDLGENKGG